MKRIVTILLAALLLVSALGTAVAGGSQEAAETETEEARPLIWYLPGGNGFPYSEAEEQAVYDEFNKLVEEAIGTTVEIRVQGKFGEYRDTMPLVLASGEYLDLVWTSTWSNNFFQNAYDGYYMGLDELLQEHGQDILADIGDQLEATRVNGEIRAVWSQQIAANTAVVEARMDIVDKYGFDMSQVDSFADLEPILREVRDNEPELIPFGPTDQPFVAGRFYHGFAHLGVLPKAIGVRADAENPQVLNMIDTPEFREWCELMWEWNQKGYIPADSLTYTKDQWNQLETNHKIVFKPHNVFNPQTAVSTTDGITTQAFPLGESVTNTSNILTTLNAVSARSTQPEKAVEFLNFLWTNPEAYNLLVWGIEGRHHESTGPNRIDPITDSGYYTNVPWVFGNTFQSKLLPNQSNDLFDEVREINANSRKVATLGFSPNIDEIKTLVASVSAVLDQYLIPVSGGYVNPDEKIPEFIAAMEQAGVNELIAALQGQLDDWRASNM